MIGALAFAAAFKLHLLTTQVAVDRAQHRCTRVRMAKPKARRLQGASQRRSGNGGGGRETERNTGAM